MFFLVKNIPFFRKFGRIHKAEFPKKFFIPRLKNPSEPMENSVDNVENQVKSSLFRGKIYLCLWKTFRKILSRGF